MRARTRTGFGALAAGVVSVLLAGTASAAPAPGAPGGRDPYYPNAGNGRTDVPHYHIPLTHQPPTDALAGRSRRRRPLLPDRGQRRPGRAPLRHPPDLPAGDRRPGRHDDAAAPRHAGPLAVRPRLRAEGVERAREKPPRPVREPDRQR